MKFKLLANKNFSLLIFGEAISLLGNSLQSFILGLVVFKITGSASSFASIMALMVIPKIILSPVAGVISDNFNRKRIIVFLDLISGIVTFLFALILHQSNTINLIYIYICNFLIYCRNIIYSNEYVNTSLSY